jgi:hypothetical protein
MCYSNILLDINLTVKVQPAAPWYAGLNYLVLYDKS